MHTTRKHSIVSLPFFYHIFNNGKAAVSKGFTTAAQFPKSILEQLRARAVDHREGAVQNLPCAPTAIPANANPELKQKREPF